MWLLKGTKTVNGNRTVPLNSKAINAIKNLEAVYNLFNMKYKFIARTRFNNPIDNNGFHDLLSRMLEKADIDKPLTIHQLRHTFASRALKLLEAM
ncbi:tyrosine-type recombinase/integrase [Clostridium sp. HV4-5-A1G]|nr:tyrosine-type recombinase/integrase [Clostridium sp. HV4-5-A1G]